MFWIRYAAIDRTNSRALGLFVKTLALGTFVRNNIVKLVRHGSLLVFATNNCTIAKVDFS